MAFYNPFNRFTKSKPATTTSTEVIKEIVILINNLIEPSQLGFIKSIVVQVGNVETDFVNITINNFGSVLPNLKSFGEIKYVIVGDKPQDVILGTLIKYKYGIEVVKASIEEDGKVVLTELSLYLTDKVVLNFTNNRLDDIHEEFKERNINDIDVVSFSNFDSDGIKHIVYTLINRLNGKHFLFIVGEKETYYNIPSIERKSLGEYLDNTFGKIKSEVNEMQVNNTEPNFNKQKEELNSNSINKSLETMPSDKFPVVINTDIVSLNNYDQYHTVKIDLNKSFNDMLLEFSKKVTSVIDKENILRVILPNSTASYRVLGDMINNEYGLEIFIIHIVANSDDTVLKKLALDGSPVTTGTFVINASGYDNLDELTEIDAGGMIVVPPFEEVDLVNKVRINNFKIQVKEDVLVDIPNNCIKGIILDQTTAANEEIVNELKKYYGWDIYVVEEPKFLPVKKLV